jgi:hypothetical protein
MKQSESAFLESIQKMPPLERAAAIAHRVYSLTSERVGWPQRVPEEWSMLDESARHYNIEGVRTWTQQAVLFEHFLHAVLEERLSRSR